MRRPQASDDVLQPAADLRKQADTLTERATSLETLAPKGDARVVMGNAISSMGQTAQELLRKWDKSSDGTLTKAEFRQGIRTPPPFGLGLSELDVKDVDAIYEQSDANDTGRLELKEVNELVIALRREAKEDKKKRDTLKDAVERLRKRSGHTLAVAKMTEAVEGADAALDDKCNKLPVDVQLGTSMMRKHLKVVDILIKWDENGDGDLDVREFRNNARQLGVHGTDAEIDALFSSYDADQKGTLNLQELKVMLKTLYDLAKTSAADIEKDEKMLTTLRKKVKKQQIVLQLESASEIRHELEKELEQMKLAHMPEARGHESPAAASPRLAAVSMETVEEGVSKPPRAAALDDSVPEEAGEPVRGREGGENNSSDGGAEGESGADDFRAGEHLADQEAEGDSGVSGQDDMEDADESSKEASAVKIDGASESFDAVTQVADEPERHEASYQNGLRLD